MKIRKSTWILLLTFVFVIVAIGAFELRKAHEDSQIGLPAILPDWTADKVIKISIKYNQDKFSLQFLRDKNNNWIYVDRQANSMPQDEINTALTELFALTPTQKLDPSTPLDWLGIVPPVASFDVMNVSGAEKMIKIGKTAPIRAGYYLQVDNEAPVIVPYNDVIQILDHIYLKVVPATWLTPLATSAPSSSSTEVSPLPFQMP
jgi:hypothetical protein